VEIANRLYFSAHATVQSWAVSDDYAYYLAERAAGGVGMIVHSTSVTSMAAPGLQATQVDTSIPSLAKTADLVHDRGARLFGQLSYIWATPLPWEFNAPSRPWLAPSVHGGFGTFAVSHAMRNGDIKAVVDLFKRGTTNLRVAGYDGIEVHLTHGSLTENFVSPYWNRRTDEYGGPLENRLRLIREILGTVREAMGPDMALGIRLNCDEMLPGGYDQAQAREILKELVSDRVLDFVDLDVGVEPHQFTIGIPNYQLPKHLYESYVRAVREGAGSVPVLAAISRVTKVSEAERALTEQSCDMVGVARGLIAEPYLVKNTLEGNEERNRTCIACNHCVAMLWRGTGFGCAINPTTARERRWGRDATQRATKRTSVAVVGGGPAGLEAARIAAVRGHDVTLFERENRLGGQYRLWSSLPGRENFYDAIAFYGPELERLGVDVRLGADASAGDVLECGAEAVVLATGARYAADGESGFVPLPIPGADQSWVHTPEQIIEDGVRPKGKVLVLDDEGLNTGVGVAEIVAADGNSVEFVTRWLHVAHNLFETLELPLIVAKLSNLGATLRPQTYVREIGRNDVTIYNVLTNIEEVIVGIDAVVLCTMRKPQGTKLLDELEGKVDQLFIVGDASGPRDHVTAFYEGAFFARMIGEPGAPRSFTDAYFATDLEVDLAFPQPAAAAEIGRPAVAAQAEDGVS
jgi:2,4-dienoyl-CoA reductase-like NADH-dependent reductase (Old Yellow Enzyme family)